MPNFSLRVTISSVLKKKSGCAHAIHSLRCVVDCAQRLGSTVNICALDLSKAFDKMNHHGLFVKLMQRRVPVTLLCALEYWFAIGLTLAEPSGTPWQTWPQSAPIWEFPVGKKSQIANFCHFFASQGRIPLPILLKFIWFMCSYSPRIYLKFGEILFIYQLLITETPRVGHFSPKLRGL